AATHRDLQADVASGRFREDLYFRLSAFVIEVPPLRERPAEIALLADLFARDLARRMAQPPPVIDPAAMSALAGHRWPGNVRELRNAIEHALVMAEGGTILAQHLPDAVRRGAAAQVDSGGRAAGPMRDRLADLERKSIEEALAAEDGHPTPAAPPPRPSPPAPLPTPP